MPDISSTVFGDRYAVEEEVGHGGMGRVLRARDLKLGRLVAVKVLSGGARDPKQLRRFQQEARAAGTLNHPNIVTVFDTGDHQGEPYSSPSCCRAGRCGRSCATARSLRRKRRSWRCNSRKASPRRTRPASSTGT